MIHFAARRLALPAAMLLLLAGCGPTAQEDGANNVAAAPPPVVENIDDPDSLGNAAPADVSAAALLTDAWVGRWTGPEGLFLDIQPAADGRAGHYAIVNQDTLDRQGSYAGVAEGATIRMTRDGQSLTIRGGKGDETGFKYLAGKADCLIVRPGAEGYCR